MKKLWLLVLSMVFSLSAIAALAGCGGDKDDSSPAECQHSWQETTAKVEAECGKAGSEAVYTCANGCGETKGGEAIAALEHDWQETAAKVEAECGKAGSEAVYTCANGCGETKGGEAIAALEHDWQETTAKVEAECGKAGSEAVYTCANGCGETKGGEEIPALEHDWQEAEGKVDPDCETAGKEVSYICVNGCDGTKGGEEIPAAGHAWTAVEAKEATCTEDGYIAHWDCDNCDAIATGEAGSQVKVEASAIVAAAKHTLATAEAQAATCTQVGWEAYEYCTACDYTEKEEFFADHTFIDGVCANAECGILVEATYLSYNGSFEGVAYADGKWTVTAESGKIMKFSAAAIKSYTDKKMGTLVFTFTSKSNQETSLNPSYNGDNAGNKKAVVTVDLTDEIKQNGLEMRIYYVSLGWTEGMDESDGFVVSVDGIVDFSYEDKTTWMSYNGSTTVVTYDETATSWTVNSMDTGKILKLDANLMKAYIEEGKTSLSITFASKAGQQTKWNMQFVGESGEDFTNNESNGGTLSVRVNIEDWMAEKGMQFKCYFYTRAWSGDPTNEDGSFVETDGFTVTIKALGGGVADAQQAFAILASEDSYVNVPRGIVTSVTSTENTVTVGGTVGTGAAGNTFSGFGLSKNAVEAWLNMGFKTFTFTMGLSADEGETAPTHSYIYDYNEKMNFFLTSNGSYQPNGCVITIDLEKLYNALPDSNPYLIFVFTNGGRWNATGSDGYLTFSNVSFSTELPA